MREPLVRIRCPSPEDAALVRSLLGAAGLGAEEQLTWLAVRDADPDLVNELLVSGGALGRAVAREQLGRLLGWLVDRQGDLAGRGPALGQIVRRALAEAGLSARYQPRPEAELLAAAARLHGELLAGRGAFVPWERFVAGFCAPRDAAGPAAPAP